MSRFIKLDAAGAELALDAINAVAIKDSRTNLIWSLKETARMTWKRACAYPASLTLCGYTDWRLPTCDELLTLVDRSRHSPAIDTAYFPDCKSERYWTSTPAAYSPGVYAWDVGFGLGGAGWDDRGADVYVRAVRPSQSLVFGGAS